MKKTNVACQSKTIMPQLKLLNKKTEILMVPFASGFEKDAAQTLFLLVILEQKTPARENCLLERGREMSRVLVYMYFVLFAILKKNT